MTFGGPDTKPAWQRAALARYGLGMYGTGIVYAEVPAPLVGQVWACIESNGEVTECAIVLVRHPQQRVGELPHVGYRFFYDIGTLTSPAVDRTEWPPPDSILVAGPGAPWVP